MADKTVILTRQEIGDAITKYIGIFKEGASFFPFRISGADQELSIPNDVMFYLDYIPKGSKSEDVSHNI